MNKEVGGTIIEENHSTELSPQKINMREMTHKKGQMRLREMQNTRKNTSDTVNRLAITGKIKCVAIKM